jgi:hypothetical protein
MTVVRELTTRDVQQRLQFTVSAQHDEVILHITLFSQKAQFHLDSTVNKCVLTEIMYHTQKITVRTAINSHGLMGTSFLWWSCEQQALFEHAAQEFCPLAECSWFMVKYAADHARWCYTTYNKHFLWLPAWQFRYTLNFPLISYSPWLQLPDSLDIYLCDFCLKEKLFPTKRASINNATRYFDCLNMWGD